ncbi:hypothetical protein Ndes2437B_g06729 [Nannochloris sp. 'desiccata']
MMAQEEHQQGHELQNEQRSTQKTFLQNWGFIVGVSYSKLLALFNFTLPQSAEDGASNNMEPQEATLQNTEHEASTDEEDEIPIPELIEKAIKARDRLNIQFARYSINSGYNHEVLITLAESAMVLDSMTRTLTEKQLQVLYLTKELFLEKLARRGREEELAGYTQRGAAELPVAENLEVNAAAVPTVAELEIDYIAQLQGQQPAPQAQERTRRRRRLFRWW